MKRTDDESAVSVLPHGAWLRAMGIVAMMLSLSVSCDGPKEDEEAFVALYNAVQAAEDHYGQGLGRARVVEKYREEVQEKVVHFKYKGDLMRSDVRVSDEKGELKREFKSVYTPEVYIWANDWSAVINERPPAMETAFGEQMHPSVFNSNGPLTLKDYFQRLYTGYHEGEVEVSVTIDRSGLIHMNTSVKHEKGNKSDVQDMVIDSEDGYRIVSTTTEFKDLDTPGHRETQTYHVNWKRYGQQWYVTSATYDRNDVVPVDGELKPFTRSWSINIEEYEAGAEIDDSEFTLAGLYEGRRMHVRDKIKGKAYAYYGDAATAEVNK